MHMTLFYGLGQWLPRIALVILLLTPLTLLELHNECYTPPTQRKALIDMVTSFAEFLEIQQIPYWADDGTLLGAVRSGGFIPWDYDADFGVFAEDVSRILALRQQFLQRDIVLGFTNRGLVLKKTLPSWLTKSSGKLFSMSLSNVVHVDIFVWKHDSNNMSNPHHGLVSRWSPVNMNRFNATYFLFSTPHSHVEFEGIRLRCPYPPEEYLDQRFKGEWRTPHRPPMRFPLGIRLYCWDYICLNSVTVFLFLFSLFMAVVVIFYFALPFAKHFVVECCRRKLLPISRDLEL